MQFTSSEWGFAATFPSQPQEQPISQTVGAATVTGRVFVVDQGASGTSAVSVVRFPDDVPFSEEGALQGAVRGGASSVGATLDEERPQEFQGYQGRFGTFTRNGVTVTLQSFIVGRRQFNLIGAPREAFDQLAGSFEVLPS